MAIMIIKEINVPKKFVYYAMIGFESDECSTFLY